MSCPKIHTQNYVREREKKKKKRKKRKEKKKKEIYAYSMKNHLLDTIQLVQSHMLTYQLIFGQSCFFLSLADQLSINLEHSGTAVALPGAMLGMEYSQTQECLLWEHCFLVMPM
jgi:hypothetical protein